MAAGSVREGGLSVWRRVLSLSWPIMIQHVFRTLMRTTDVVVTGLFSPAAVAAVGLADLYARFPLRIGLGLGSGAIALSSQDTGGDAIENRDQAVTQAVLLGLVSGIPFVAFGVLFGEQAIALLGAPDNVAEMGGTYLAIVFASAPARHVALVAARALQGTGDTQTPMYVDVTSSILNIAGSVILGLGLFGAPRLAIVGVGIATVAGNCFTAGVLSLAIWSDRTAASFTRPRDWVIAKQLLAVSAPRIGEGLITTLAEFPFNALLLTFGTDVNAAYQIGRRMYQQVTSPLGRAYHTATSVVVGQSLGDGDVAGARFQGWATTVLAVGTMGAIGVGLFVGADWLVALFTSDPATAGYATGFARAYAVAAPAIGAYLALAGALQGGSDTRTPFVARVSGLFVFLLGFSYLTSVVLAWGVVGIYAAIALQQFWALAVVAWGFARGDWAAKAAAMMDERGSVDSDGTRFIRPDPTAGMDLISVAAVAENGVIGKDDEVPWHLPADKEQYRDRVAGHPTVFGRRTYEMFADPPGSAHIVLSRTERDFEAADTHYASDVAEAVDIVESLGADRAYVLGGSGIYELFQPHLDGMVLTRVPDEYEGDTYYPEWDEGDWDLVATEAYERFTVETWERLAATETEGDGR